MDASGKGGFKVHGAVGAGWVPTRLSGIFRAHSEEPPTLGGGVEREGGLYVVHSDGWMGEKEGAKAVDGRFQKVNPPGSNKAGDWETKGLKSTTTLVLDHFEWGRNGGSNWV